MSQESSNCYNQLYNRQLSKNEQKEAEDNLCGFFRVLIEIDQSLNSKSNDSHF